MSTSLQATPRWFLLRCGHDQDEMIKPGNVFKKLRPAGMSVLHCTGRFGGVSFIGQECKYSQVFIWLYASANRSLSIIMTTRVQTFTDKRVLQRFAADLPQCPRPSVRAINPSLRIWAFRNPHYWNVFPSLCQSIVDELSPDSKKNALQWRSITIEEHR